MKPLIRSEVNRQIEEMWNAVNRMTDEDNGRAEAAQNAMVEQAALYKQLDIQDKAFILLWSAVHKINPENPLIAAGKIAANAERLIPILKAYQ